MPGTDLTEDEWAAVYARAVQGESVKALAREMGRDPTALYRMLKRRYGYRAADFRRAVWAPTYTPPTSETERAYLAGIFDGEGSLIFSDRSNVNRGLWIARVSMTYEPLVRWLQSFGGTLVLRPPERAHYKPQFCWQISRQIDVKIFLEAVYPYLTVKRERADEALAFFAAMPILSHDGRRQQYPAEAEPA